MGCVGGIIHWSQPLILTLWDIQVKPQAKKKAKASWKLIKGPWKNSKLFDPKMEFFKLNNNTYKWPKINGFGVKWPQTKWSQGRLDSDGQMILTFHWLVVSNVYIYIFIYLFFHPYLGKIPSLTKIFQRGWNDQHSFTFSEFLGALSSREIKRSDF